MAYEVPPLPYDYSALEPYIDTETMHLHHDKHHQAYVTNLNGAIEKHPDLGKHSAEDLLRNLNSVPEDVRTVVRNNGGGHVNHSMFWTIMKPKGGGDPTGAIGEQIKKDFASFEDFKKQFNDDHRQAVRLRLGLAHLGRQAENPHHSQSGQPALPGPLPHPRQRFFGVMSYRTTPVERPACDRFSHDFSQRRLSGRGPSNDHQ